ncbi:Serine/threonine-protein kinase B [Legionella busanensis]|uniref:Serine/threonine-protein kinase B n=1 Tax=Legionella busanensis TaxID=190655 RepID=A0A378JG73_9GAMM|nr:pentapeptide repeat-containing protein [Legionella busanensis]STX50185.1 Serine/threonine-protein kinase B [Legionella busanensis]
MAYPVIKFILGIDNTKSLQEAIIQAWRKGHDKLRIEFYSKLGKKVDSVVVDVSFQNEKLEDCINFTSTPEAIDKIREDHRKIITAKLQSILKIVRETRQDSERTLKEEAEKKLTHYMKNFPKNTYNINFEVLEKLLKLEIIRKKITCLGNLATYLYRQSEQALYQELLTILSRNIELLNVSTEVNPKQDYTKKNLQYLVFHRSSMQNCKFTQANLSHAILVDCSLSFTNFEGANLTNTYLQGSDLSNANLIGADLSGADFTDANLNKVNWGHAKFSDTTIIDYNKYGPDIIFSQLDAIGEAHDLNLAQKKAHARECLNKIIPKISSNKTLLKLITLINEKNGKYAYLREEQAWWRFNNYGNTKTWSTIMSLLKKQFDANVLGETTLNREDRDSYSQEELHTFLKVLAEHHGRGFGTVSHTQVPYYLKIKDRLDNLNHLNSLFINYKKDLENKIIRLAAAMPSDVKISYYKEETREIDLAKIIKQSGTGHSLYWHSGTLRDKYRWKAHSSELHPELSAAISWLNVSEQMLQKLKETQLFDSKLIIDIRTIIEDKEGELGINDSASLIEIKDLLLKYNNLGELQYATSNNTSSNTSSYTF